MMLRISLITLFITAAAAVTASAQSLVTLSPASVALLGSVVSREHAASEQGVRDRFGRWRVADVGASATQPRCASVAQVLGQRERLQSVRQLHHDVLLALVHVGHHAVAARPANGN